LIRHLADAERAWFRRYYRGEHVPEVYARPDNLLADDAKAGDAHADLDRLFNELESVREALVGSTLDDRFNHERFGDMTLRWFYNHMIAKYARHIGPADLLRERIDGVTGNRRWEVSSLAN
jgi:hypothetical protein